MNDDPILPEAKKLARRMLGRLWSTLREEQRNTETLQSSAVQLVTEVAKDFKPAVNPYTALRELYSNAGMPWKDSDDEQLRRLHEGGNSIDDLMLVLGRSRKAITMRLERLGLLPAAA